MSAKRGSRAPTDGQERLLTGWGRTAPTRARIAAPTVPGEVAAILGRPPVRGAIARGLGRSYGDAAQNAGGTVIATRGLAASPQLDAATGRVRVAAGTSLGELIADVLPRGWFPAVVPGTQYVTIGGASRVTSTARTITATAASANTSRGLELAVPSGARLALAPDGPDADAFWATAGGMGLTGVTLSAELQLRPVASARMRVDTTRTRDLEESMSVLREADAAAQYTVAWIDLLARGAALGRGGRHRRRARDRR